MEHMDSMGTREAAAMIARYDWRIARLSRRGRVLGYMQAWDGSLLEVPKRWWRAGAPVEPRLAWLIEWTDPGMSENGYTDEAGDVGGHDIAEVVAGWDEGRHQRTGAWLQVSWLDAGECAAIDARFDW